MQKNKPTLTSTQDRSRRRILICTLQALYAALLPPRTACRHFPRHQHVRAAPSLPCGIVAVEASAADGVVALVVDDTGVGIPAEELPLVFERFYRSDQSRARESGRAGIGLALVSELVAAMGGSVDVQSTPGRGSRFSVALRQAP